MSWYFQIPTEFYSSKWSVNVFWNTYNYQFYEKQRRIPPTVKTSRSLQMRYSRLHVLL